MTNSTRAAVLEWSECGFSDDEAREWINAATARFTPNTALAWKREGFGPNDAALWSEIYVDPAAARARRSAGYLDPFS